VIETQLKMKPEDFDKKFLTWLEAQTKTTVEGFDHWRKQIKDLPSAAKAGNYDEVIRVGNAIRDSYPEYVETGSVYEFLADAYAAKGDKTSEMKQLERYSTVGGRSPLLLKRLSKLQEDAGKKVEAAHTLQRLNYIYPMDGELHQRLGDLYMATGNNAGAVTEYAAVIASKPGDQAGSHFNLAKALRATNRVDDAKEQLLLALEAAPGYKPAQRMLLEITK